MKKLLFSAFLLTALPGFAQADLVVAGAMLGLSALKKGPQKPDVFVTQQVYQGQTFPQKRTPPKKASPEVERLEAFLTDRYAVLVKDSTTEITTGKEAELIVFRSTVANTNPKWNLAAYDAEWQFYRQVDSQRRSILQARAQQLRERQEQEALRIAAQQAQAQQEAAVKAAALAHSADSLRQVAALAEAAKAPYRTMYVNTPTLTMREAATTAAAPVLKLHAPAAITVYKEPANAKYAKASYAIDSYTGEIRIWDGWVEKAYLVPTRENVTATSTDSEVEFLPGDPLMPSAVAVSGRNSVATYGKGKSKSYRINGTPVERGRQYMRGPRGGCYYYSPSGGKVYVDRSLCN